MIMEELAAGPSFPTWTMQPDKVGSRLFRNGWRRSGARRLDLEDESVVIVPSVSMPRTVAAGSAITQAFEERSLFLLLLLRQPRLRMIYVTSMPINSRIVEYYLALLPGVIRVTPSLV